MVSTTADFSQQEQARIVGAALDLFMEHGIAPVTQEQLALALRLPLSVLERYFPGGKPALVVAVTAQYVTNFHQQIAQHSPQSANAVEEMLRMRQTVQALPDEMRSLFPQELEADYPVQYQHLRTGVVASISVFLRLNLQRGAAEGLYQPQLDVETEVQAWFEQAEAAARNAATSQVLSEKLAEQVTDFLNRVTTPGGAYVARRLQEAPPYY